MDASFASNDSTRGPQRGPSAGFVMHQEEMSVTDEDSDRESIQYMHGPTEGFVMHQEEMMRAASPAPSTPPEPPPPVCDPVAFDGTGVNLDPDKNPFEPGDVTLVSLLFPPTGTTPITYEWFVNGESRSTTEVFEYTVLSGDVHDKVGDFGVITISLTIRNDCGEAELDPFEINVFDP